MTNTTPHRLLVAASLVALMVMAPLAKAGPVAAPAPQGTAASGPKITSNKIGPQKPILPPDKAPAEAAKKVQAK